MIGLRWKEQEIGSEGVKFANSVLSVVKNSRGDYNPLLVINGGSVMPLPDVPEDRPLDEISKVNRNEDSFSNGKGSELEHDSSSVKLKNNDVEKIANLDESKKSQNDDVVTSVVPQRDEKPTAQKNEKESNLAQPVANNRSSSEQ
ncbi:hypothetical protein KIW84_041598, partial [Lathyrus oleraceus]